jgi:ABC-type glycerol-3-phosphate transport system substrate-binding protein
LAGGVWSYTRATRKRETLTVLTQSSDYSRRWLVQNVLAKFSEETGIDVELTHYADVGTISAELDELREAGKVPDLIELPLFAGQAFAESGLVGPIEATAKRAGATDEDVRRLRSRMVPQATTAADYLTIAGRRWFFLPRRLDGHVLVYRKDKVAYAASHWEPHVAAINERLATLGYPGLPGHYKLEADPRSWDFYDVLVAGYVWAQADRGNGRVARRSFRYFGAVAELLDLAVALGAAVNDLFGPTHFMTEALEWERARTALGVYHPSMADHERGASESTIVDLFAKGEIYLATMHPRYLREVLSAADDSGHDSPQRDRATQGNLGVAPLPYGALLDSTDSGDAERPPPPQTHRALIEGTLVGILKGSDQPAAAWKLASYLSSVQATGPEDETFFQLPLWKDAPEPSSALGRQVAAALGPALQDAAHLTVPRFADLSTWKHYRDGLLTLLSDKALRQLDPSVRIDPSEHRRAALERALRALGRRLLAASKEQRSASRSAD